MSARDSNTGQRVPFWHVPPALADAAERGHSLAPFTVVGPFLLASLIVVVSQAVELVAAS